VNILGKLLPSGSLSSERLPLFAIWGLSILLLITFSMGDLLILLYSEWPHLHGVLGVSAIRWEENVAYLPFANAFSVGTPFPYAPAFDQGLSGISVFPSLSLLIAAMLLKFVALGNANCFLLLCHGVLPVLNFWLAYLIFSRFVSKTWAILLGLLGIGYFSGFHFGPTLIEVMQSGEWSALVYARMPEISRFPFPGISLACFLFAFLVTIGSTRPSNGRIAMLALLWGLQIHVYAFNFIAGVAFFALWIPYEIRKSEGTLNLRAILLQWGILLLVAGTCAVPFLIALNSAVGQQMLDKMFAPETSGYLVTSDWGWFASHGIPLILLALTFVIFRADKHELFHRFGPVFIALSVDLFIGALPLLSGNLIDPELYFHRISNLFFRFLYFVPFLHFISIQRPMRRIPHDEEWTRIREKVARLLHKAMHKPRIAWTSVGIAVYCVFVWSNSFAIYRSHEDNVVGPMLEVQKQFDLAEEINLPENTIVVFEDLIPNLLVSAVSEQVSLLPSSASNQIEEERIRERILLYAKIFDWPEEKLMKFFEPNPQFLSNDSFKGRQLVNRELIEPGLGNWLINYKKEMSVSDREAQLKVIRKQYKDMKIADLLIELPVSAIIAKSTDLQTPDGFTKRVTESGYLILTPVSP
tara:strand:- start:12666 stop:14585 length:1920 start_codon:yes stop_codon:yes gene_type:complete